MQSSSVGTAADWLSQHSDVQGEFIRLSIDLTRKRITATDLSQWEVLARPILRSLDCAARSGEWCVADAAEHAFARFTKESTLDLRA
jgi:hypothetical protein